jgi:hypothetical protein
VFSITLTAQAARMACDSDPARLPELLDRIQESSADALAEMRILVSELRLRREVLRTIFSIDGEERGPRPAERGLRGGDSALPA